MARDRLPKIAFAIQIRFLNGTESGAVLMEIHKGTLRAIYQRCNQLTVFVIIVNVTSLDDFQAFGPHEFLDSLQIVFNASNLIRFQRGTGIAFHTTPTLAAWQIAAKFGV